MPISHEFMNVSVLQNCTWINQFHLLSIIELVSYVSSSFFPPQEGAPVNYEREGMTDVSVPLAIFQQKTLWIHVSSKSDYDVCLLLNFDSCWLTIDLRFDLNLIKLMSCHSFESYFVATWLLVRLSIIATLSLWFWGNGSLGQPWALEWCGASWGEAAGQTPEKAAVLASPTSHLFPSFFSCKKQLLTWIINGNFIFPGGFPASWVCWFVPPFFEVPQKESSTKDEKKATKDEEMKDEQSEGFPSRWMIGKKVFFGRMWLQLVMFFAVNTIRSTCRCDFWSFWNQFTLPFQVWTLTVALRFV